MSYRVQVIRVRPSGPESDTGMPAAVFPEHFETIEAAVEHAEASLRGVGYEPGTHLYDVLDESGRSALHLLGSKQ